MARPKKIDRIHSVTELDAERCKTHVIHPEAVHRAQANLPANDIVAGMTALLGALGDPTRLRIIAVLANEELCVGDIAAALGLQQSAISHQLRFLRQLGLAKSRREGRHVYYSVDDEHVSTLFTQAYEHVIHQAERAS